MAPLRYDLRIRQGQTWSLAVPVKNPDETTADLTGYTATAQVRDGYASGTALHTWSIGAGNLTLGAGQITLTVSPATSAAWAWRRGRWDLELTAPSGTVTALVTGSVLIDPEITR